MDTNADWLTVYSRHYCNVIKLRRLTDGNKHEPCFFVCVLTFQEAEKRLSLYRILQLQGVFGL